MLHIVQVVSWGVAETPQVFADEAQAQAAYVASTEKHWEQRYGAYCEHHGLNKDAFTSARAFVKSIDASEKSAVNLWSVPFEEAGPAQSKAPGPGQEGVEKVAKEIVAVKEGLARLLDDVSKLAKGFAGPDELADESPTESQPAESPVQAMPAASSVPVVTSESDPARYTTKEWSIFVADIRRLCSGSRNEFTLLPKGAWRDDVYSNATSLEYWDWVADRMERYKEAAKAADYTVITDADSPDYLKFTNRQGDTSEESYNSEWEAWCAAGLYLAEKR